MACLELVDLYPAWEQLLRGIQEALGTAEEEEEAWAGICKQVVVLVAVLPGLDHALSMSIHWSIQTILHCWQLKGVILYVNN